MLRDAKLYTTPSREALGAEEKDAARAGDEGRRRLSEASGIDSEALIERLERLGFTAGTVVLLDMLPAVEVAWAERILTARERDVLLLIADDLGVEPGSPARRLLLTYLAESPGEEFFVEARALLAAAIEAMPEMEASMRRMDVVDFCREVASASGGMLVRFGFGNAVSREEREVIARVTAHLGRPRPTAAHVVPSP